MSGGSLEVDLFGGSGEMRARCRDVDWSSTALGPVAGWSQSLRTLVPAVLASRQPMFLFWGPELVQIYNDAYRPSLGRGGREERALGAKAKEFWTDIWDTIGPQIDQVMSGGEATWFEDQLLPIERNGQLEEVYWTYSYSPVRDDDGSVGGTLVVCQETTGRVVVELELDRVRAQALAAREHLERVITQAPIAMYIARGREHVFDVVNDAWFRLTGKLAAEVVGKSVRDVFPELVGQGVIDLIERVYDSGEAHHANAFPAALDTDGDGVLENHFYNLVYQPLRDREGKVYAIALVANDVTALEEARRQSEAARAALSESEARFRTVQDASPDVSMLMRAIRGEDGKIVDFEVTYSNSAVQTILLGREENVLGRTMRDAFPESVQAGRLDRYVEIVETGKRWLEDVHYTRGPVSHGLRVSAVKVGDGVHLSAADLTERIHAAEERERLLEEAESARLAAENANRAKSEFLAVMSHELRTPLNAIAGYCELLELGIHGPVTGEQRHALARIQASQRHLLGLITSVLNYARVEGGVLTYASEDVPIAETVATCEALTAPQMRAKSLNFGTSIVEAELAARADREKVQQVLLNLLGNAIKFTSNNGRIDVHSLADGDRVVITVTDSGVGISNDNLARVFEPFVQVDSRFTRAHEGVGLGLAISRDLARGMGGDLRAESEVGVGSTFTLTLPRV
jgi:two-component system sensor histidine kinase VicK